jgi:hypothetical protein
MDSVYLNFLGQYLLAFLLTLSLEGGVAYLLGLRTGKEMLVVAMANVITHPVLNYLLLLLTSLGFDVSRTLIVILEILVVVAEWQILLYVFSSPKWRFFMTSLLANATSFLIGVLLFGI